MNTSGLLQSLREARLRVVFARDPKYSWSMNIPKNEFIAYIYIL